MASIETELNRVILHDGGTTLTLDKAAGQAVLQRKILLWNKKPDVFPLAEIDDIAVKSETDAMSGATLYHSVMHRRSGEITCSPRSRPRPPRRRCRRCAASSGCIRRWSDPEALVRGTCRAAQEVAIAHRAVDRAGRTRAKLTVLKRQRSTVRAQLISLMSPPPLPYVAVPESFKLPPGMNFGGTSGVAFNSKGNIFVLHRGPMPVMEFDADGNFIRGFGDGLFERPHGLRIDAEDNIWATDVASNLVYKFNPEGRLVMVLGAKGHSGEWHPFGHLRLFHEPNEAVVGPTGDIFVLQGHGKAESLVLKQA